MHGLLVQLADVRRRWIPSEWLDCSRVYRLVSYLAERWPHRAHKQRQPYPVPHVDSYGYWEDPNLAMRLDLIRYMRKGLRDCIVAHPTEPGKFP